MQNVQLFSEKNFVDTISVDAISSGCYKESTLESGSFDIVLPLCTDFTRGFEEGTPRGFVD
jgi:hypothetical protein